MAPRLAPLGWLACLSTFALMAGCPAKSSGPDAGTSVDAGHRDAGAADAGDGKCHQDEDCPASQYCELATGACLDAKPCQSNDDCDSETDGDYCAYGKCFCDPARNGGSCRPRFALCAACDSDLECGSDPFIYLDYTATCVDGGSGSKVCLPLKPQCPPGYVASTGPNCAPAGGRCGATPTCTKNDDCDPMGTTPECDVHRGFCVAPCVFDYRTGTSDCPTGEACHVDPRLLDAANPNFGGGQCGAPCDAATDPFVCPTSDDAKSEACVADGAPTLSPPPTRCRPPPPHCLRDEDCPAAPDTHARGYCDRTTLDCQTGCRSDGDCVIGYQCAAGACVLESCLDQGALLACDLSQFCCGEAGGPTCPTGVDSGQCYAAPNPPWCAACTDSAQTPPGGARPQPSKCVTYQDPNGATHQIEWHACDKTKSGQCPRSWGCTSFIQFCQTDADCGPGGSCGDVDAGPMGKYKGCLCPNGPAQCPAPSVCDPKGSGACLADWCDNRYCLAPPP